MTFLNSHLSVGRIAGRTRGAHYSKAKGLRAFPGIMQQKMYPFFGEASRCDVKFLPPDYHTGLASDAGSQPNCLTKINDFQNKNKREFRFSYLFLTSCCLNFL